MLVQQRVDLQVPHTRIYCLDVQYSASGSHHSMQSSTAQWLDLPIAGLASCLHAADTQLFWGGVAVPLLLVPVVPPQSCLLDPNRTMWARPSNSKTRRFSNPPPPPHFLGWHRCPTFLGFSCTARVLPTGLQSQKCAIRLDLPTAGPVGSLTRRRTPHVSGVALRPHFSGSQR